MTSIEPEEQEGLTLKLMEQEFDEFNRSQMESWGRRNGWVPESEVSLKEQKSLERLLNLSHKEITRLGGSTHRSSLEELVKGRIDQLKKETK